MNADNFREQKEQQVEYGLMKLLVSFQLDKVLTSFNHDKEFIRSFKNPLTDYFEKGEPIVLLTNFFT